MLSVEESGYKLKNLKISTFAITSVVAVEFILGFIVGSLAILSDGVHALLDAFSMFVLLIATRVSLKPPDEEHMYGHEKIETIGGLLGGMVLLGTSIFLMIESVLRLRENKSYLVSDLEFAGFVAIAYTFCIDILRVGALHRAKKESVTVKAGFYHALADLGSTLIAFLGFGLATLGFYYGDALASIVLGAIINYLSVKLIWSSGMELSDAVSKDIAEKVRREILGTMGAPKYKNLKIRKAGAKTFVEATVQVPDFMSLEESHTLASEIEEKIKNSLGDADVTIHLEPLETEISTEKLVEKLATEVEGVKESHEVSCYYMDGKLYITLHAGVDPKLSMREAHQIAEKIENKIRGRIENVENVTVHMEPFEAPLLKGSALDEREIWEVVQKTAESFRQVFRIKRMVTYVAGKKRYINIDCCFTSEVSMKDAHKIASKIERDIEGRFTETIVTVHAEPE